jgi:hypothetical protein
MAFNPTSAREQRAEDRRTARAERGGHFATQIFTCCRCRRSVTVPFTSMAAAIYEDRNYMLAVAPDPWVTLNGNDWCPDCFESEIPPPILPATET